MLGSYIYWIGTAALILSLFMSLLRRQTLKELAEVRRKLLDERQDREQLRAELVHARTTAEKDVAGAKKQAAEAKSTITTIEEQKSSLEQERDALRSELETTRLSLADRTVAEESARSRAAELETQLKSALDGQDKLGAVGRDLQTAQTKIEALEKKLESEARLRKAAEDERNTAKSTVTMLESKQREAEWTKSDLASAHAKELQALQASSSTLETELKEAKERLAKADEELAAERSKVQTAAPAPASAAGGGDLISALEADPYLNRGQKETIRMTYNQFTAKRRSS